MVWVRKEQAGSDSFGNTWDAAGAVVDVPYDEAVELLSIKDGGFSEGTAPVPADADGTADPDTDDDPDGPDANGGGTEPAKTEIHEAPAAKPPTKPRAGSKTTKE